MRPDSGSSVTPEAVRSTTMACHVPCGTCVRVETKSVWRSDQDRDQPGRGSFVCPSCHTRESEAVRRNRALLDSEGAVVVAVVPYACFHGLWNLSSAPFALACRCRLRSFIHCGCGCAMQLNAQQCSSVHSCSASQRHRVGVTPRARHLEVGSQPQHGSFIRHRQVAVHGGNREGTTLPSTSESPMSPPGGPMMCSSCWHNLGQQAAVIQYSPALLIRSLLCLLQMSQ